MKLLTLSVLMFSNICSFAEKPHDSGADKRLILEVIWGTPDNPKCKLNGEVSPDGLFTLKSKDGRYAGGPKTETEQDITNQPATASESRPNSY